MNYWTLLVIGPLGALFVVFIAHGFYKASRQLDESIDKVMNAINEQGAADRVHPEETKGNPE